MKHVIIGTAGHVDHGKPVLIKALTGIDTDRLAEEKRRGITIDLGFAHLDWPDGAQAGIVDVPGHEKFIKNMLAGAGGIDLALLVIGADEGVMPQTVEHLDILSLLGIRDGLVVLTKADLVDDGWLELVRAQAADLVRGTFLEGKPILPVSAVTGTGLPELKEALHRLVLDAREKSALAPFRLPIDRVFSVDGFGTVVTGTLIEGAVRPGDTVELVPSGLSGRVRTVQVHGKAVDAACEKAKAAGARRALRLPVGGAFHSPLMEPARAELAEAIAEAPIHTPVCPIYQNVDAKPRTDPAVIRENLIAQLTAPVRWTQIVRNMLADGATEFTELGPGSVLQGLIRKVDPNTVVESKSTL